MLDDAEHGHGLVDHHSPLLHRGDGPIQLGSDLEIEDPGIHLAAVEVLPPVEEPLDRPAGTLGHDRRAVGAAQVPGHLAPAAEAGALVKAVDVDLVHGHAAEPGGDGPLADMGPLLLDPDLGVLAVPSQHAAGALRADPGIQPLGELELDDLVRFGEALLHVAVALDVHAPAVQIAFGVLLGVAQRGTGLQRFLHIENEGALLPLHPYQPQSLFGDLLASAHTKAPTSSPWKWAIWGRGGTLLSSWPPRLAPSGSSGSS